MQASEWKDRIVDFKRIPVRDLSPHPLNPRSHTDAQRESLNGALTEIGVADVCVIRGTENGWQVLDGHLRSEGDGDFEMPCVVVDLDNREAALFMASHDRIAELAEWSGEKITELLDGIKVEDGSLGDLLAGLPDEASEALKAVPEGSTPKLPKSKQFETVTVSATIDGAATIRSAIMKAKLESSEESDGVALEAICQQWLDLNS